MSTSKNVRKKERVKQKTIVLPKQAEIASKHSSEGTKIEEENAKITDLSMVCKGKESVVAGSSTVWKEKESTAKAK